MIKVHSDLDLRGVNHLVSACLENLAIAPAATEPGHIYWDDTADELWIYNGTSFVLINPTVAVPVVATQVQTDAGADDTTFISPLKLTTFMQNKSVVVKDYMNFTTDGIASTFTVTSTNTGFTSNECIVQVQDAADKVVLIEVTIAHPNYTVDFGYVPPIAGYTLVVIH